MVLPVLDEWVKTRTCIGLIWTSRFRSVGSKRPFKSQPCAIRWRTCTSNRLTATRRDSGSWYPISATYYGRKSTSVRCSPNIDDRLQASRSQGTIHRPLSFTEQQLFAALPRYLAQMALFKKCMPATLRTSLYFLEAAGGSNAQHRLKGARTRFGLRSVRVHGPRIGMQPSCNPNWHGRA